jgi:hypothetical protein
MSIPRRGFIVLRLIARAPSLERNTYSTGRITSSMGVTGVENLIVFWPVSRSRRPRGMLLRERILNDCRQGYGKLSGPVVETRMGKRGPAISVNAGPTGKRRSSEDLTVADDRTRLHQSAPGRSSYGQRVASEPAAEAGRDLWLVHRRNGRRARVSASDIVALNKTASR